LVINKETGETVEYVSQKAAAIALEVSPATVHKCLKSKKLLKQNYIILLKSID
jgi:Mn-dependent DtxR family transcriptional regulator